MALLKKLFGRKEPLERVRSCCTRQEWAEALALIGELQVEDLELGQRAEVEEMERVAGNGLAELNLEEGEWAARSGNALQAREHFQLARDQARTEEMRRKASEALESFASGGKGGGGGKGEETARELGCGGSCAPPAQPLEGVEGPDELTRVELLLATLPEDLASRYAAAGDDFLRAWLAGQEGDPARGLEILEQVPENQRDALFRSERGLLLLRQGEKRAARLEMETARQAEPELQPALEGLVHLLAQEEDWAGLERLLRDELEAGRQEGFCSGQLARLLARRGESEEALASGRRALASGAGDAELLVLCAALEEGTGRQAQAEALLMRLPGGGCGGGVHPLLAEFWLRQEKNLDRALESFKGALRQERDNPRWLLRIAQTYLARGWRSEAAVQLDRLLAGGPLPEELRAEADRVAERLQGG